MKPYKKAKAAETVSAAMSSYASELKDLPCCICGGTADWLYMPASDLPPERTWFCDEHVPRGCSCNKEPKDGDYENGDPSNWIQPTDSRGRKYPCCEFLYIT